MREQLAARLHAPRLSTGVLAAHSQAGRRFRCAEHAIGHAHGPAAPDRVDRAARTTVPEGQHKFGARDDQVVAHQRRSAAMARVIGQIFRQPDACERA